MLIELLLVLCFIGRQEGDVDRIMLRLAQRREKVQSQAEFSRLLSETRTALEAYLKDHSQAADAGRAAFHIAETYLWSADYSNGVSKLRSVLEDYPNSEDAPTAAFLIGQVLLREDDVSKAREALQDFVRRYPKDDRVLLARNLIAVTFQNEEKYADAEAMLLETRNAFKDRKESWSTLLQLAVVSHLQEKNDDARRVLTQIVSECPDRSLVAMARKEIDLYAKAGSTPEPFRATDLSGNGLSSDKARGQVLILYFFDAAAPAAGQEVLFLQRIRKTFEGKPLALWGVSLNTDRQDALNFRDLQKISWPILFDGRGYDGPLARQFDVRGLPALIVLDKTGKMRYFNIAGKDLENAVSRLLPEP
jgi:TolA-binding protein/peroxiredoxin